MKGWITLHRSIRDHWIFERDDYFKAWMIMLMEVNHKENKTLIKGKLLSCPRGQSLMSHQSWADKFGKGWNRAKVMRFFKTLESDHMIVQSNEQVTTRLSICNYSKYQDIGAKSGQVNEHQTLQQADSKRTGDGTQPNNVNNENNEKRGAKAKRFVPPTLEQVFDYCKQRDNKIDPETFVNHYESVSWMRGKNKIKDWKACVRTWESRDKFESKNLKDLTNDELFKISEGLNVNSGGLGRAALISAIEAKQ